MNYLSAIFLTISLFTKFLLIYFSHNYSSYLLLESYSIIFFSILGNPHEIFQDNVKIYNNLLKSKIILGVLFLINTTCFIFSIFTKLDIAILTSGIFTVYIFTIIVGLHKNELLNPTHYILTSTFLLIHTLFNNNFYVIVYLITVILLIICLILNKNHNSKINHLRLFKVYFYIYKNNIKFTLIKSIITRLDLIAFSYIFDEKFILNYDIIKRISSIFITFITSNHISYYYIDSENININKQKKIFFLLYILALFSIALGNIYIIATSYSLLINYIASLKPIFSVILRKKEYYRWRINSVIYSSLLVFSQPLPAEYAIFLLVFTSINTTSLFKIKKSSSQ